LTTERGLIHAVRIKTKRVKKGPARHQRIVTTGSIGISRWRREDWLILRAAKQMGVKQRDESDGSEITALPSREVCRISVNSNHRGWYFQHDTTVYLPDKFTKQIKHRCTTSNYNQLTHTSLIEFSLNKKIAELILNYIIDIINLFRQ